MLICALGVNHGSAPLELRERLSYTDETRAAALAALRQQYDEIVILDTCNRSEVYCASREAHDPAAGLLSFLAGFHGLDAEQLRPHIYAHLQRDAIAHLFAVACGIDSFVVGETQIMSQVHAALAFAEQRQDCGFTLSALFRHALHVGKRARTETAISRGVTSLGSLAVECAQAHMGSLAGRRALIVGAGRMGALAARHLRLSGVSEVFVCSRTPAHARQLADEIGGQPVPFEQMSAVLPACDVVISATSLPHVILTVQMVGAALAGRTRPLTIVDLALPRDVEPAVGTLERVHLIDLNALQALTAAHLEQRLAEVASVERIVDEELESFWRWLRSLSVTPTIVALRERAERIRQSELDDHLGRLQNLSAHDRRVIETMTASIVGRLLHEPTLRLKQRANGADGL